MTSKATLRPTTPLVTTLPASVPFVGPEAQERSRGRVFQARLGANENGFGPSPKAIKAMEDAAADCWKYGDPESHDLRAALADHHGIGAANIVVGEGIDGLLGYLVRMYTEPGRTVVTSDGAYPTFNYHVAGFGAELVKVPYRNDHEDLEALAEKARETKAALVYLANPDNPMGTWHGPEKVAAFLDALPECALLVLDEAYVDTAPEGTAMPLDVEDTRLVRMRTFSKAYGMAGARVGYALGQRDVIEGFNKVRNHFGMSRIAQAGALAALKDQAYLSEVRQKIETSRRRIAGIAAAQGLKTLPSATNFVAIDCGRDGGFARRVLAALIERDIFVRMPFVAPEDRAIRISCGPEAEMAAFEAAFADALKAAEG